MFAKALCLNALFICLFVPSASEATDVSGSIVSNTVWTAANSPYHVVGNVTVFPGFTLTVESGVTVNVDPDVTITIRGAISCVGSIGAYIRFTSSAPPARWNRLELDCANEAYGQFEYVIFSYAGFGLYQLFASDVYPPATTVRHCTFSDNGTGIGGYCMTVMDVFDCSFMNNVFGLMNADKTVTDCSFLGNTWGVYEAERIDLHHSIFVGNTTGVYGGRGLMEDCSISASAIGVQGMYQGFTMHRNVVTDNGIGVQFTTYDGNSNEATFNDIYGNTVNAEVLGTANVSAPNNWWGTTDTSLINAGIYDGYDNPSRGLLLYQPFSTQPNVGATPVRPTSWGRVKQLWR